MRCQRHLPALAAADQLTGRPLDMVSSGGRLATHGTGSEARPSDPGAIGHELAAVEKGPHCLQGASARWDQIKLATGRETKFYTAQRPGWLVSIRPVTQEAYPNE